MGENSSFIFACYIKTVPLYDFKLVCVVLHPSSKNFSKECTNESKIAMLHRVVLIELEISLIHSMKVSDEFSGNI